MGRVMYDCFSNGLDDLKRSEQRDLATVLRKLSTMKRFSTFEASDNMTIAKTMTKLFERGYVRSTGGEFPWTEFEITDAGKALMAAAPSIAQDGQKSEGA